MAASSKSAAPAAQPAHKGAIVIDGSGLYLAPGLIDSHVHLGDIPGMTPEQEAQHPDIAAAASAHHFFPIHNCPAFCHPT